MSNLSVQLPDSLYRSLQELAQQEGISVDQFIVEPEPYDQLPPV